MCMCMCTLKRFWLTSETTVWVGVNVRPNSVAVAINADDVVAVAVIIAAVMEVTNDIKRLNFYNDSQTENGVTRKE